MARLLVNENVPLSSVKILRDNGFDILLKSDNSPGLNDEDVLRLAREQTRTLITFDRDYGELVFRCKLLCPPAIIYLRFDPDNPLETAAILQMFFSRAEDDIHGYFFALDRDGVRKRPLPAET
ncbi:MAG: DUF5615 family PIN-like protein [Gammaproteobacteria bacterium]|nr:DUF5615 family PIN-like protein [Gammaproteobacteria bacterium]